MTPGGGGGVGCVTPGRGGGVRICESWKGGGVRMCDSWGPGYVTPGGGGRIRNEQTTDRFAVLRIMENMYSPETD